MQWPEYALILLLAAIALAGLHRGRRLRARIGIVEQQRDRVATEEQRVFDFLHQIGEALALDSRGDVLHRFIVEGAIRITEAHGGAIYLADRRGENVRRAFGSAEHTILFPIPDDAARTHDLSERS